ncbi:hypothetical protein [uncultured Agathobaculum sp.]
MTKKNYIHALGMIGESMAMCNAGCAWKDNIAYRGFSRNHK